MKRLIVPLFILLLMYGCGTSGSDMALYEASEQSYAADNVAYDEVLAPAADVAGATTIGNTGNVEVAPQPFVEKKKIIRSGRMGLQVVELQSAKRQVDSLVNAWGGYYASENYSSSSGQPEYVLAIRVPSERYDTFLAAVEGNTGKILYKEVSATDITEDYVDVETRLANKQSYLERYRELLGRAATIKEVLEVEEQIRQLEEEIESAEGRLRYMDDRVAYSSLSLMLTTEYKYVPAEQDSFPQRLLGAISAGWRGIIGFALVMVYIWPLWVVAAAVFFIWRYFRRKKRR